MAEKTIDELNSELATVTEQTRNSYDVLYTDRAGKRGLYKRLSIAENSLKKKGLLPGVKEKLRQHYQRKDRPEKAKKFEDAKGGLFGWFKQLKK